MLIDARTIVAGLVIIALGHRAPFLTRIRIVITAGFITVTGTNPLANGETFIGASPQTRTIAARFA